MQLTALNVKRKLVPMDTEYLIVAEYKLMPDPPIYHWYRINKETGEIGPIA